MSVFKPIPTVNQKKWRGSESAETHVPSKRGDTFGIPKNIDIALFPSQNARPSSFLGLAKNFLFSLQFSPTFSLFKRRNWSSPMAINLTEGAIMMMCRGELKAEEVKPVVQVIDVKQVSTQAQQHSNTERFRVLLSDGSHHQQGMLATQMNALVKDGRLQKGSVVQLTQFVCNVVQNRM
jgi:hypothetical protein